MTGIEKAKGILSKVIDVDVSLGNIDGNYSWKVMHINGAYIEVNVNWDLISIFEEIVIGLAQSDFASNVKYIHAISGAAMKEGVR